MLPQSLPMGLPDCPRCAPLSLQALADALGDRKGIHRFGNFCAPLDEALVHVVLVRPSRPASPSPGCRLPCSKTVPGEDHWAWSLSSCRPCLWPGLFLRHMRSSQPCSRLLSLVSTSFCALAALFVDVGRYNCVQDLSGRPHLSYDLALPTERIGNYETQVGAEARRHWPRPVFALDSTPFWAAPVRLRGKVAPACLFFPRHARSGGCVHTLPTATDSLGPEPARCLPRLCLLGRSADCRPAACSWWSTSFSPWSTPPA